ncbi:hypothetical protein GY45DRAFT_169905 [Cubamyces sp. BRFM 1775]|nr:hypothetical protein GY45DRAFT_169905 [Cubamyces sp. BRFM 1775]
MPNSPQDKASTVARRYRALHHESARPLCTLAHRTGVALGRLRYVDPDGIPACCSSHAPAEGRCPPNWWRSRRQYQFYRLDAFFQEVMSTRPTAFTSAVNFCREREGLHNHLARPRRLLGMCIPLEPTKVSIGRYIGYFWNWPVKISAQLDELLMFQYPHICQIPNPHSMGANAMSV